MATQPPLAHQRLQRALDHGVPAAWVTGESVEGDQRSLRLWLAEPRHAHVWAVSGTAQVWRAGRQPQGPTLLAALAAEGWCRWSAGDGAPGPRWQDWTWLPLATPRQPHGRRWLWVRRSLRAPTELTAYGVLAPHGTGLATVVQVAGSRGTVARCCEAAKGEVGLDQSAGRSGTGWPRPITLALWAYALLTVRRAAHLPAAPPLKKISPGSRRSRLTAFKTSRGLVCR